MHEPARPGLIEPAELDRLLTWRDPCLKILDASLPLPGASAVPFDFYSRMRIADAGWFDIAAISDRNTDLPHMLPGPEAFAAAVSVLGISNSDRVVVYGQDGIIMGASRAWWMFRVFGHENVQVLNGGLPAWKAAGYRVETGAPNSPALGRFMPAFNPALIINQKQILQNLNQPGSILWDARPAGRFAGNAPEPRPGLLGGHIPGSLNRPAVSLVDENGLLKSRAEIETLFPERNSTSKAATCGSGVTACVIALALYSIGIEDVPVYDGSWSEWGQIERKMPVETGISD